MIVEGLPLWYFETNSYIVGDEATGKAVVIDIPAEAEKVMERLEAKGLELAAILLTHGHIDHVSGAGALSRLAGGVPVYISDDDRPGLENPKQAMGRLASLASGLDLRAPDDIRSIKEGDTVDAGGFDFKPIRTPGHTPGHICYLLSDPRSDAEAGENEGAASILFSGDHLFAGSVGRTDLPGGSWQTLLDSLREKIMTLPDETTVAPGHGPVTTIGRERKTNPFVLEALG